MDYNNFYKKAEEFLNIEDTSKFFYDTLKFSDGKATSYWFRRNRKIIETSDSLVCKKIMEQYDDYLKMVRSNEVKMCGEFSKSLLVEFANIKDLNKFDPRCEIMLSNGMTCGNLFCKYRKNILTLSDKFSLGIDEQYKRYLLQKKQNELKKQMRYKHEFYFERDLNKFCSYSKLFFSDKHKMMYDWFNENKNRIIEISQRCKAEGNAECIEAKIIKQYQQYLSFYELKQDFLRESGYAKFFDAGDEIVRFSSGASMNMWWEDSCELILASNCPIDVAIHEQYNNYVKTMKHKNN